MSFHTNAQKPPDFETDSARRIAAAYDTLAPDYDSQLLAADWIRLCLWERMDALFPSGSRVLDVTAGSGADVLNLRKRGVSVTACDISEGMLVLLHEKVPDVQIHVIDFNHLDMQGEFDGVISTFAGLNTSSNLEPFSNHVARLLHPGGTLLIHMLNRWPLLEIARQFVGFQWRSALRSLTNSQRAVNLGGFIIPHYLYSPLRLYRRVFASYFRLERISGQGIVRPLNVDWGWRLERAERRLSDLFPFHSLGLFFSIEMTRI